MLEKRDGKGFEVAQVASDSFDITRTASRLGFLDGAWHEHVGGGAGRVELGQKVGHIHLDKFCFAHGIVDVAHALNVILDCARFKV